MIEENIFQHSRPYGEHYDCLFGPNADLIWERSWQHNLILNNLGIVLASLLKNGSQQQPLAYWAIGSGDSQWDRGRLPIEVDRLGRSELYNEVDRKEIKPENLSLGSNRETSQLECSMKFVSERETYSMREFGLLARDPAASRKFLLINHQIHARIDMQPGFTLQRTIRLTF